MQNMIKRTISFLAVVLAGIMIAGALTACNSDETRKSEKPAKTEETKKEVEVVDALNYSKDVIGYFEENNYSGMKHELTLPKITLETKNAKAFNEKLFATFSDEYEALKGDLEGNKLYYCDYEYKIYDGVIGIIIRTNRGVQSGGSHNKFEAFFYDTDADKELSFDKYIEKLGFAEEELKEAISNTDGYKLTMEDFLDKNPKIESVILDRENTVVILSTNETVDGFFRMETEAIIK